MGSLERLVENLWLDAAGATKKPYSLIQYFAEVGTKNIKKKNGWKLCGKKASCSNCGNAVWKL